MLKSELLELIKDIDDSGDINDLLLAQEEYKSLAKPLDLNSIGVEEFKQLLASNKEVQAYNQSTMDSSVSKGVESFKAKKLPLEIQKAVEEALKAKNNEGKDPVALELAELKKELAREKLVGQYTNVLAKEGLSDFSALLLNSDSEDTIKANIEVLKANLNTLVSSQVEARVKGGSYVPPVTTGQVNTMTKTDLLKKSIAEINKYKIDNPTEYKALMEQ